MDEERRGSKCLFMLEKQKCDSWVAIFGDRSLMTLTDIFVKGGDQGLGWVKKRTLVSGVCVGVMATCCGGGVDFVVWLLFQSAPQWSYPVMPAP